MERLSVAEALRRKDRRRRRGWTVVGHELRWVWQIARKFGHPSSQGMWYSFAAGINDQVRSRDGIAARVYMRQEENVFFEAKILLEIDKNKAVSCARISKRWLRIDEITWNSLQRADNFVKYINKFEKLKIIFKYILITICNLILF